MSAQPSPLLRARAPAEAAFRADWMPADAYISPAYVDLEDERLWARTWQIACREEELPDVGDFVTYEILDESIIILRVAPDRLAAHYNVCPHRGRRLREGRGNTGKSIFCRFHGWTWDLDGGVRKITDRDDWNGCPEFGDGDLGLKPVRLDRWGGFVWICMDTDAEPLADYLSPVPDVFANFDLADLRFAWSKTLVAPCNWKVMIDAFNEGYHTEATHPQVGRRSALGTASAAHGKHSMFWFPDPVRARERMAAAPPGADIRAALLEALIDTRKTLNALVSDYKVRAAERLLQEAILEPSPATVLARLDELHREELERAGARWPDRLTAADLARAGTDWHIFPNTIVLPTTDSFLWYRARPKGRTADSSLFDVWCLERFADGAAPAVEHEFYADTAAFAGQNPFLEQDFGNVAAVQKGMKSRGFAGARTNPVQETPINNFHRVLYRYLATPPDEPPPVI